MRLLAVTIATLALGTGCAVGPDARDAKALLERAQAEQAKLASAAYDVRLTAKSAGRTFAFRVDGAAQLRGANAGDQYVRVRASGVQAGAVEMTLAKRGPHVRVSMNGNVQTFEAGRSDAPDLDALGQFGSLDFASCVEQLDVAEGRSLNGEPATRIGGVVDTGCLLRAASKMNGLSETAGQPFDLGELAKHVGDVRATLFVSERTHLLIGAVVSTEIEAEGFSASVQLSYRLTSVNRPLRFPRGF